MLLARVKWANVAKLAAVLAAVALVAAWPRLEDGPPAVPAGRAVPVAGPRPATTPAVRPRRVRPQRRHARVGRRMKRHVLHSPPKRWRAAPVPRAVERPREAAPTPAQTQAAEFGLEGR